MAGKKFEFLEHTADIKFRAWGKSLNEVFENCVLAVSHVIGRGIKIKSAKEKKIEISGEDNESLLYKLIDEIIYLLDSENFVAAGAKIEIKGKELKGVFYGDSSENYNGLEHIKAATYAEMHVKKIGDKNFEAQAVIDV